MDKRIERARHLYLVVHETPDRKYVRLEAVSASFAGAKIVAAHKLPKDTKWAGTFKIK